VGETVTLFDVTQHAQFTLTQLTKRTVQAILLGATLHKKLSPKIIFYVPLLKRADLETALYSLVEVGVTTIQLISTQKTAKELHSEKEFTRFHNIIIAAAEQSKNFIFPELKAPVPLSSLWPTLSNDSSFIYFDPAGKPLLQIITKLVTQQPTSLILMTGPEGDLTTEEKEAVKNHGAQFCALTPTVLTSAQAIALGAGVMRSIL
jgi:RsmE family RNA methyltransferase